MRFVSIIPPEDSHLHLGIFRSHQAKALTDFGVDPQSVLKHQNLKLTDTWMLLVFDTTVDEPIAGILQYIKKPKRVSNTYDSRHLPIELVLSQLDPKALAYLEVLSENHCISEPSGLWTSRAFRKQGLGQAVLIMGQALSEILGSSCALTISSPQVLNVFQSLAFKALHRFGLNGVYRYPSEDYSSTLMEWQKPNEVDDALSVDVNSQIESNAVNQKNLFKSHMLGSRHELKSCEVELNASGLYVPQYIGDKSSPINQ